MGAAVNERRPKQLIKIRGTGPVKLPISHAASATEQQRVRVKEMRGSPKIVRCSHGVVWLDCTKCSRSRR